MTKASMIAQKVRDRHKKPIALALFGNAPGGRGGAKKGRGTKEGGREGRGTGRFRASVL